MTPFLTQQPVKITTSVRKGWFNERRQWRERRGACLIKTQGDDDGFSLSHDDRGNAADDHHFCISNLNSRKCLHEMFHVNKFICSFFLFTRYSSVFFIRNFWKKSRIKIIRILSETIIFFYGNSITNSSSSRRAWTIRMSAAASIHSA